MAVVGSGVSTRMGSHLRKAWAAGVPCVEDCKEGGMDGEGRVV
jgi:hypothetical protein